MIMANFYGVFTDYVIHSFRYFRWLHSLIPNKETLGKVATVVIPILQRPETAMCSSLHQ